MDTLIRYGGDYLIDDLIMQRMSVADATEFNDPFEFHFSPGEPLSTSLAKQRVRKAMKSPAVLAHQKMVSEKFGISRKEKRRLLREHSKAIVEGFKQGDGMSIEGLREEIFRFTKEVAKIVCCTRDYVEDDAQNCMWAYYANDHRGVRLHLNDSFYSRLVKWFDINYMDDPPIFETAEMESPERLKEFVMNAIGRKSDAWIHEKEVRLLIPIEEVFLAEDVQGTKRHFTPLTEQQVVRIDFGIRYEKTESTWKRVAEKLPSVPVFRAIKSPKSYRVEYEQLK